MGCWFWWEKYDYLVDVVFKIKINNSTKKLFLWASFFESNTHIVRLDKNKDGYSYKTQLIPREEIYYQLYDSIPLGKGLLPSKTNKNPGFVTTIISDDTSNIIHNL